MPEDVLHDNDRIIHDDTRNQHKCKKADGVQGYFADVHDDDGTKKGKRNAHCRQHGVSEAQADPEDNEYQSHPENQVAAQGFD